MFRGSKRTDMSAKNFGVGSLIIGGNDRYTVVAVTEDMVRLLDLNTFELCGSSVRVADYNFLSEEEVRALVHGLEGAFSDYDYDPKGIKPIK